MNLIPKPLTSKQFAPFGKVIEKYPHTGNTDRCYTINEGFATRHHGLAIADIEGGATGISIFAAKPRTTPVELVMMEYHPLGTQAFMGLSNEPYLVAVAEAGKTNLRAEDIHVFIAQPDQGVQYSKGVWHHPLLALNKPCDFLVMDRIGGDGNNCIEQDIRALGLNVTLDRVI